MKRDRIADDQMVALALAMLAIERPGWLNTLRELAEDRALLVNFDIFFSIHKEDGP